MRLTRRRFLGTLGGATIAAIAAACGVGLPSISPSGTGSASASATPTPPPEPTPSPTSGPSLREKIGQMLLVGFRGLTIEESASIVADIRDRNLGGVLLFDYDTPTAKPVRNVASPEQLTALVSGLQAVAATPLIVAIDEEGGRVARLDQRHGFPPTVSAQAMGKRNDLAFTRAEAGRMATTLRAVGVNLNLAPVVDLNVNPTNPIIGSLGRSFSADPTVVTAQAGAFIDAQHQVGVACTLKHFPGHGSSTGDTHLGVVDVTTTWSEVELEPFRRLVAGGTVDAVLTAHVFNSTLDPDYPATLSRATVTGILRERLGYDGLVLSDDMQMGAIRDEFGYEDAVRLAINAGVDVLTIANQQVFEDGIVGTTIDLVERLVGEGRISQDRIDASYRRVQALKAAWR
jgi:beta-N-acetylhexosaminidase